MLYFQKTAREKCEDEEIKQIFVSIYEESQILSCKESVTKLLFILGTETFTSGDHVAYYDILDKFTDGN